MNNAARESLRQIIKKYGNDLCGDARRCEGLLKDLCGEHRREINVLVNAVEERIPLDLLAAEKTMPRQLLLTKLAKRLEDNLGLTVQAANWAVDSWALALGIVTDSEIAEKEKRQNEKSLPIEKIPAPRIEPKNNQVRNNSAQTSPPRTQSKTRPQPPVFYPPTPRTPANFPSPSPKSPPPTVNPNIYQQNIPAQTNNPAGNPAPKKRFGKFFGCLFVLTFLALVGVVLILGVPFAIERMRETQRSEPPRFPVR